MGPQSFNCGNAEMTSRSWFHKNASFNGAAVFCSCGKTSAAISWGLVIGGGPLLQWGRSLSTAETAEGFQGCRTTPCSRFNGAAVFQLRKHGGLLHATSSAAANIQRFNGAAVFQLRKEPLVSEYHAALTKASFIGAAVF